MKVAAGLGVDQTDGIAVSDEPGFGLGIVVGLPSVGVKEPFVIGIFVMVTSDLLLVRSLGISRR